MTIFWQVWEERQSLPIEGVLAKVYPKLGFDQNCKYVFNADSTFSHSFKIAGKVVKLDGTYSIDKSNKNIVFTYKVSTCPSSPVFTVLSNSFLTLDNVSLVDV